MRIARGRLHPVATEQPADDRQPLAEREGPGREAVSERMQAWGLPRVVRGLDAGAAQ